MIEEFTCSATRLEVDNNYERLAESPLYQTYKKAFYDATGLSLKLVPARDGFQVASSEQNHTTSFCQALGAKCLKAGRCQLAKNRPGLSSGDNSATTTCFANMKDTAIPIRSGETVIAILTTGQVFVDEEIKGKASFSEVYQQLKSLDLSESQLEKLWLETPNLKKDQYKGAITLLAAFALQLSEFHNRILLEAQTTEPEAVSKAKRYINSHLDEKIELEIVAKESGVSSYYFCKLFKQHTKMTLTEYVNRRRVEWAKQKLKDRRNRITEIAYDIGYQSLSQFNRSFSKYVGMSPSQFRNSLEVSVSPPEGKQSDKWNKITSQLVS